MCLKVMAQFPGCNKYGIDKLMRLKIPGLCLVKDFADIVDWLLDGPDPGHRVRLTLVHHVRSLGPQRFWVPTGSRLRQTPLCEVRIFRQRSGCRTPVSMARLTIFGWGDPGVPLASLLRPLGDQHHADRLYRRS